MVSEPDVSSNATSVSFAASWSDTEAVVEAGHSCEASGRLSASSFADVVPAALLTLLTGMADTGAGADGIVDAGT